MIQSYKNLTPETDQSVFIAPPATVIGDVEIGKDFRIWFYLVVEGDVHQIRVGQSTNIPDGSIMFLQFTHLSFHQK